GFDLAMMCLGKLRVTFEIYNQSIIRARLPDSQPGKERNQKQHRHNGNVVWCRSNLPELVPVLDRIDKQSEQNDNDAQADYFVSARISNRLFDDRAHFFFSTFISDSSMTGDGPEIPPSLRIRQKCTAINIEATSGIPMQCQMYARSNALAST